MSKSHMSHISVRPQLYATTGTHKIVMVQISKLLNTLIPVIVNARARPSETVPRLQPVGSSYPPPVLLG